MVAKIIPSTCSECSTRCGSLIHIEDDKVVRITGNPAHPGSRGAFCIKGMNAPVSERDNPARITSPMRRVGKRADGQWERITWDEALDEIADGFAKVKSKYGALSIAGTAPTHTMTNALAVRLLMRALGSPNYMINQDMCHGGKYTATLLSGFGGKPGRELAKARVILVVGESPSESNVIEWMDIKAAKAKGAKLIVVDPRRSQTAKLADHWLAVKPGTDAALALCMIHVILSEQLFDHEFVEQWSTGIDGLRDRAAKYPPEVAAQLTGIPAQSIVGVARLFADVRPGSLVIGHGVDAQANAVGTILAFQSLLALTGNVDREGTNKLTKKPAGWRDDFNDNPSYRMPRQIEEQIIGGKSYPLWSGPDSALKTCHNPAVLRAVHTSDPYPVRAMYVTNNVVVTYPDMQSTVAALKHLDLLVVVSDQMTPTSELADYFLPRTTMLEEEDAFLDPNSPCISYTQRVFAPRGEAKSGLEIAIALRERLASRGAIDFDVLPWASERDLIEYKLRDTNISLEGLQAHGFHEFSGGYEGYRRTGFKTPSKKFEFRSSRLEALALDLYPDYSAPDYASAPAEYGLTLLTGIRTMTYHHSRFRNHSWARRMQDAPELRINPITAKRLNIGNREWVWVKTPKQASRVLLKAHLTDEMPENVVGTGMGWWYPEMAGPNYGASLCGIAMAVSYGAPWDPLSGAPEARNTACSVVRAEPSEVDALLKDAREGRAKTKSLQASVSSPMETVPA